MNFTNYIFHRIKKKVGYGSFPGKRHQVIHPVFQTSEIWNIQKPICMKNTGESACINTLIVV